MKRLSGLLWLLAVCAASLAPAGLPAHAAPLGTATADFDNLRPNRNETAWGRLVADAMRSSTKSDVAFVYAFALKAGTLKAGPIKGGDIDALLPLGDDEVVTLTISGAQLRAALERAVQAYPTGSPAFLHLSGFMAEFNAQSPINRRLTMVRYKSREVTDQDVFSVAMPIGLARDAGYSTIWDSKKARRTGSTLRDAVADFIRERREVTPDPTARLAPH
ncbi:MAG TPA: 5'-nucleotidase [Abditibacteriaceae bacterium]|nr:5'-nucleotidase [Abditibacteriaceae bacterium]